MEDTKIFLPEDSPHGIPIGTEIPEINEKVKKTIPERLGVLPLYKLTVFPFQIAPLIVVSERSVKMIDDAIMSHRFFMGVTVKTEEIEKEPGIEDLYKFGTVCKILKMIRVPNNKLRLLIQGITRAHIVEYITGEKPYIEARIKIAEEILEKDIELDALKRNVVELFQKVLSRIPNIGEELQIIVMNIDDPGKIADLVASNLNLSVAERQEILETLDIKKRLEKVLFYLNRELEVLELGSKIQTKIKSHLDKKQREFFLRQELEAIKKELGELDETTAEVNELREKIKKANMPPEVEKVALKELDRLSKMQPGFAEYTVVRTYIEWLIELPWNKSTEDNYDLENAKKILDEDHYNLEKIKERIIEYLAVKKIKEDMKGPILCFVGPPGVGKTSLGMSIARALGRKFVRISLGGIRDEAEIRGHRRTYVGALPGRIILGMKNAGSNNPVFMLDEIDKIGLDFRGDPSAALLEVLDPQQNHSFVDHYLDVPFDLSKVFFIATANITDTIPPALLDRMEILRLPGYTVEEKVQIAKKYLVPRQLKEHGIEKYKIRFTQSALRRIIKEYTREAGVRNLEREIGNICRKIARKIAEGKKFHPVVTREHVPVYLGPQKFFPEVAERITIPGIATGLAWTPSGGSILFIEATKMPGDGKLKLTGQLGDVMKESANIALSYLNSNAEKFGIDPQIFRKSNFHIHVPEGAIPKDGPSAGITLVSALYSLLKNKKVRSDIAMTGEITLRGKVLPVGGIKEKVLAAREAGIKTVILPKHNEKDLDELPKHVKNDIKFIFVDKIENVLNIVLDEK